MAIVLTQAAPQYVGLSTDKKPSGVPAGSLFLESDSGKLYVYNGTDWWTPPPVFQSMVHVAGVLESIDDTLKQLLEYFQTA